MPKTRPLIDVVFMLKDDAFQCYDTEMNDLGIYHKDDLLHEAGYRGWHLIPFALMVAVREFEESITRKGQ